MKPSTIFNAFKMFAGLALLLTGCSQPPVSFSNAAYQSSSQSLMAKFARQISSAKNRAMVIGGNNPSSFYGGYMLRGSIDQEAQDCVSYVQSIPHTSANYLPMVASLAQCLVSISQYQNPLNAFLFRNMNQPGQSDFVYTADWRQYGLQYPNFSLNSGLNPLYQYASTGMLGQNYPAPY